MDFVHAVCRILGLSTEVTSYYDRARRLAQWFYPGTLPASPQAVPSPFPLIRPGTVLLPHFHRGSVQVLLVRYGKQVDIDGVLNKVIGGGCAFPAKSEPAQQIAAQLMRGLVFIGRATPEKPHQLFDELVGLCVANADVHKYAEMFEVLKSTCDVAIRSDIHPETSRLANPPVGSSNDECKLLCSPPRVGSPSDTSSPSASRVVSIVVQRVLSTPGRGHTLECAACGVGYGYQHGEKACVRCGAAVTPRGTITTPRSRTPKQIDNSNCL